MANNASKSEFDSKSNVATTAPSASSRIQQTKDEHKRSPVSMRRFHIFGIVSTACIAVVLAFVGLIFFARPTESQVEKRTLTELPAMSVEGVMDGSFFTDFGLWYSDTFPLREWFVSLSQRFQRLYGVEAREQFVGGNVRADDLPEEGKRSENSEQDEGPVEPPDVNAAQADAQAQFMNGLYVRDGAAYSIYYFNQPAVEQYVDTINRAARRLDGEATVYSIIVPNNAAIELDEDLRKKLGGSDQEQAIRYFYSLYDENIKTVSVTKTLREHVGEYLYFRSDHHWTGRAAYYTYLEFCKVKGTEPADVLTWRRVSFEPFLGSYYGQLGNYDMAAKPDHVDAYIPPSTNDLTYWDSYGNETAGNVIIDVTGWNQNSLYSCFIMGDQPIEKIENPSLDDGSSCVVIKDSFGNAFVPCLVEDYQTIWVLDFRYAAYDIPTFVRDNNIQDVIFCNNVSMASTDSLVAILSSRVAAETPDSD